MTINLAARGLAATVVTLPPGSRVLVVGGTLREAGEMINSLMHELPGEAVAAATRTNGAETVRLANGTRVSTASTQDDRRLRDKLNAAVIVLTRYAREVASERHIDLRPLFALGAEAAYCD